jgi:hypothetical protein
MGLYISMYHAATAHVRDAAQEVQGDVLCERQGEMSLSLRFPEAPSIQRNHKTEMLETGMTGISGDLIQKLETTCR